MRCNKEKGKLLFNDSHSKGASDTIKCFNTITGHPSQGLAVKPVGSNQQSARTKQNKAAVKSTRTNSSCMQPQKALNNFMLKKGSGGAQVSSARGSAGNQPMDSIFVDQNGKLYLKKKISLKQQYSTQANNQAQSIK